MCNQYVKHCYNSSSIKIRQSSPDSFRIQGPSKIQLCLLIQSLLSKNAIKRVENVKSLVLQSPVPSPRASPRVEARDRHKQAQHLSTCRKVQMETPIRASLIPGEWVSSINLSDEYLHIPILQNSRKYLAQWIINQERSELKPTQVFRPWATKIYQDLAPLNPLTEMAQFSEFDPTLKVKTCF